MIWEVEYGPRAQEDLDEIFEYYATDQLDDSFAESLIVRLVNAADSLAEMPLRHRLYPEGRAAALSSQQLQPFGCLCHAR